MGLSEAGDPNIGASQGPRRRILSSRHSQSGAAGTPQPEDRAEPATGFFIGQPIPSRSKNISRFNYFDDIHIQARILQWGEDTCAMVSSSALGATDLDNRRRVNPESFLTWTLQHSHQLSNKGRAG